MPLNNKVPPELAEYQSIVSPAAGVAEIVTGPVPHLEFGTPVGAVGTGVPLTTTVYVVEPVFFVMDASVTVKLTV